MTTNKNMVSEDLSKAGEASVMVSSDQEDQRPLRARGGDAYSALSNHPPSI